MPHEDDMNEEPPPFRGEMRGRGYYGRGGSY